VTTAGAGRVRPMERRDLDGVVALWTALTEHHARRDPLFALRPGAEAEIRALWTRQLRDPDVATFVWDDGRDLAGFCSVRVDRAPPILAEVVRAEITDVAVREERRRRGVGRALVGAATDWAAARGIGRVEVRVARRNREGGCFWRALGFGRFVDVLHRRL
jgi:GNAT superfamily N-acetyltransferase